MLRLTMTENGAVRGVPAADPRITVFRGIPFAAPPTGELRWRAPQPAASWTGVRDCSAFAPIAMQETPGERPGFYTREWHVDPDVPMDEDCLYLNVWTPARSSAERLPVMVWIFGGGMCCGYPSEMEFDGERIARRGVVMVSVNYRVNAFGFLAHAALTEEGRRYGEPGANFGLLDQRAGIAWVKRNIAAFGGDAQNITIFGQSAGGRSVWMQIASPMNRGLFQKAIAQSGALGGGIADYPSLEQAQQDGENFLRYLGAASIADARAIPARELMDRTLAYTGHRWGPAIDGTFLPVSPMRAIAEGICNDVSLMAGNTVDEVRAFQLGNSVAEFQENARRLYGDAAKDFLHAAGIATDEQLAAYYRSPAFSIFEKGNAFATRCFSRAGRKPPYLYRFHPQIPGDDAGSFHSSDLWFVFETLAKCWRPFQGKHYDLARRMCNYWTNFARSGDPNGNDNDGCPMPRWLPASEEDWHVQFLGDDIHDISAPLDTLMTFELDHMLQQAQREKGGGR